jgi:hypothetical protein
MTGEVAPVWFARPNALIPLVAILARKTHASTGRMSRKAAMAPPSLMYAESER